jgi:arylsulfatase A-like enzyme
MDYRALRTSRYKYIHWIQHPDQDELYDLESDTLELRNLVADPGFRTVKTELKAELGRRVLHAIGLEGR